ncbi:MAG: disulfide bond formation protein DsbD [Gammaproteobacteria bacterium]|nr:MAG: disulfide bond formation protein DsbD [Gammaproteobacteria bacterium]RLA60668.1 MAG: disulfide bond formation protein DsbD [Gammaproteobacteria bacterium]
MRALLASLLLLLSAYSYAQGFGEPNRAPFGTAGSGPRFLPVEDAYQLEVEILDAQQVRLYWQIADNYYLYQHRFAFTLHDSAGQTEKVEVELPPALARNDEYFGAVKVYYNSADILLYTQGRPRRATLSVSSQGCADAGLCYPPQKQFFELDFAAGTVRSVTPPAAQPVNQQPTDDTGGIGVLLYMLALAFVGGCILNLMPCVFPILSLKVLSFARSTEHDRHLQSWMYTAGVIASFVLVAAVLITLQQAGSAIGWGFQLQSPGFVIALAYLFVAMGLSLSGLVQLGGNVMNAGSGLAAQGGLSGSFFTGVLAVVVASPCTAPFMGTALGFAITRPPQIGLLVFAALGAGMAAPLLLFSYSGAARKLMPRPGPWMETLKQLLAFPLYGTAIWLLWVAGRQTGVNTMTAALSGALVLAMGLWLWRYGGWRRGLAVACMLATINLGAWRGLDENGSHTAQLAAGKVAWSEQQVAQLRGAGNPVFVDVTADWCITCIANETAVLNTDEMTAAFAAHGVVYMIADWTSYNPAIAALLERHGRTGIPLYLMYPADSSREPLILPQILTKNTVLDALRSVSDKSPEVVGAF